MTDNTLWISFSGEDNDTSPVRTLAVLDCDVPDIPFGGYLELSRTAQPRQGDTVVRIYRGQRFAVVVGRYRVIPEDPAIRHFDADDGQPAIYCTPSAASLKAWLLSWS